MHLSQNMAHWIYLVSVAFVPAVGYVLFMKKFYHLHEEYLASLKKDEGNAKYEV